MADFNISSLKAFVSSPSFPTKKGMVAATKGAMQRVSPLKKENQALYKTALVIGGLLASAGYAWMTTKGSNSGNANPIKPEPNAQPLLLPPYPFEMRHYLAGLPPLKLPVPRSLDADKFGLVPFVFSGMCPMPEATPQLIDWQLRYLNLAQYFPQTKGEPIFINDSFVFSELGKMSDENAHPIDVKQQSETHSVLQNYIKDDSSKSVETKPEASGNYLLPLGIKVAALISFIFLVRKFSKSCSKSSLEDIGRHRTSGNVVSKEESNEKKKDNLTIDALELILEQAPEAFEGQKEQLRKTFSQLNQIDTELDKFEGYLKAARLKAEELQKTMAQERYQVFIQKDKQPLPQL